MDFISILRFYFFYPSFFDIIIFPGLILFAVILLTAIWFERKAAARVQMRVGPYYASKRSGGFLQLVADALKFVFSEMIIPDQVNPTLFVLAPALLLMISILPFAVVPVSIIPKSGSIFSPYFHDFYDPNIGMGVLSGFFTQYNLVLVLALEAIYPIFIIFMGWVTNNRFAILGSVRETMLSVSYDVLIFMATVSLALEFHTLDIAQIVQRGIPGILANPFAALVFFIGMLIGSSRFPFDIVEAETELVVGPATEYSGFLFVITMAPAYIGNFIYSFIFVDLFLGGWLPFTGLPGAAYTALKAVIVLFFSVFMRSVYGRYRLDQALRGSWKYLFPLSLFALIFGMVVGFLWIA
ncbi:NADH:ubiquinone oxidoreductase subunit H [Candidatus Acidianus copahuensis]|uniref:NADH:ubiquinone oxidoreductase subunit H n=1 Tax=Candidatus Acidianus copahuensis TaxID=1160895 RepID=A0A031LQF5_9CREN|nr:NADH-quinone oxidoreductase subunit NuoH [Candidatus Acidianus copahuensis]EZQ06980.1 NADH:ubiquinone oxidoreductase subunit H [Candidatus Acidianus copahuensis]